MTTRVGVVSDTHYPRRARELPDIVKEALSGVDLIIHAGDLCDLEVLNELGQIAHVEAVAGNRDPADLKVLLPKQKLISINGYTIGITHGDGTSGRTIERAKKTFREEKPDCIVFGHSHIPSSEWVDGILMFNPGSPTDRRRQPYPSFGIITLNSNLKGEIFYFDGQKIL